MTKYAGIGSRETPMPILMNMELIGAMLGARGFELRSGQAKGADTAFEVGCNSVKGVKTIRTPSVGPRGQDGTSRPWMDHAAMFHPAWGECDHFARCAHARNSAIILGDTLTDPVDFVVCWTDGGGMTGGTGQALRVATAYAVPVFNLWHDDALNCMWSFIAERGL